MRVLPLVALIAVVAFVGCEPPKKADTMQDTTPANTAPRMDGGSTNVMLPAGSKNLHMVSMKVAMHCPYSCYPAVEKTLTAENGVKGVKLAEQKVEGIIDNPVVYISTTEDFDPSKAIADLEKNGFESEVLTN